MPKKSCKTEDGKKGIKWGDHGKCYTGPDAEEKMAAQRRAIKRSQQLAEEKKAGKKGAQKKGN